MDQNQYILENLGIDKTKFGKIYSFVDFGNVNYWFEKYDRNFNNEIIKKGGKLIVDIEKLGNFVDLFSDKKFFYYGFDPARLSSLHIKHKAEKQARFKVISKEIQHIKHYIKLNDNFNADYLRKDRGGNYVMIPKCNFDVELTIDAVRFLNEYNCFVLFSSDSDFASLLGYLKKKGKKVILIYSGHTSKHVLQQSDLQINAIRIKELICKIKYPG